VDNNDLTSRQNNVITAINQVRTRHTPPTPRQTPTSLHSEIAEAIQVVKEYGEKADFTSLRIEEVLGKE
jgi:hypothetical protein